MPGLLHFPGGLSFELLGFTIQPQGEGARRLPSRFQHGNGMSAAKGFVGAVPESAEKTKGKLESLPFVFSAMFCLELSPHCAKLSQSASEKIYKLL